MSDSKDEQIEFKNKKWFIFIANSNSETKQQKDVMKKKIEARGGKVQIVLNSLIDYVICIYSMHLKHHESFITNTTTIFNRCKELGKPFLSFEFLVQQRYDSLEDYRITEINYQKKSMIYRHAVDGTTANVFSLFDDMSVNEETSEKDIDSDSDIDKPVEIDGQGSEFWDLFFNADNTETKEGTVTNKIEEEREGEDDFFGSFSFVEDNQVDKSTEEEVVTTNDIYYKYLVDFKIQNQEISQQAQNQHNEKLISSLQEKPGHIGIIKNGEFLISHQYGYVKQMSMGKNGFIVTINSNSQLQTFGKLTKSLKISENTFKQHSNGKYKQVTIAMDHLLAIDIHGHCWSYGVNKFGQLGIGPDSQHQTNYQILHEIRLPQRVQMVACDNYYSAALTTAGKIYTWGLNNSGQLGIGNLKNQSEPQLVQGGDLEKNYQATFITCAEQHMMVMDQSNRVYCWGTYTDQRNEKSCHTTRPVLIDNSKSLKKIFSIQKISVIMTENPSQIHVFGHDSEGIQNELLDLIHNEFKSSNNYQLLSLRGKLAVKILNPYYALKMMLYGGQTESFSEYFHQYHKSKSADYVKDDTFYRSLIDVTLQSDNLVAFKCIYQYYKSIDQILFRCALWEKSSIIEYILQKGLVNINFIDKSTGQNALHHCALQNNIIVAKVLLKYHCNRNIEDAKGLTAMHIAVINKYFNFSILLAKNGAQAIPDKNMKTPVQYLHDADSKSKLQSAIFTNEIFLSYAHKDSAFVSQLRLQLESMSLRCWLDEYRLEAGCDWRSEIIKGLENCQFVFFVISEVSVNSLWCRKELKISKKLGKVVIPILYQQVPIDPVLLGLFDIPPVAYHDGQTLIPFCDTEENAYLVHKEMKKISKLIKTGWFTERKEFPQNSKLIEKYTRSKMVYLSFSNIDRALNDLIKESLISRGVPTINRDDIHGRPSAKDDEFSKQNIKLKRKKEKELQLQKELEERQEFEQKEKERKIKWKQEIKLKKLLEKKLAMDPNFVHSQEYYLLTNPVSNGINSFSNDSHNGAYIDTPTSVHSHVTFSMDDQEMGLPDLSFNVNNYVKREEDYYIEDHGKVKEVKVDQVQECIIECLLHLVLFTDKSDVSFIEKEIEQGLLYDKTIIIVTPKIQYKSLAPQNAQSLTWFEIHYQKEDIFLDNLIYNYEILEKTFNINKQYQELFNQKEQERIQVETQKQNELLEAKKLKRLQLLGLA
ncbi:Toll-Interleukin (TIR) receptor domain-containing protein [Tieghemostelium lacteum]|uniref:Toll-Interleukin (TIR) receptor domain-containing protein n=1 Tax=Tieghemostelium lacteum TaxID=361077 RepID=A0A151Z316_TIELA|nr:Toll-Interleukin (TIR) receptor domain-containing protein [Tieghemostelium lacteum]|eukprot:KYQ88341.1 Toll-Interleukin (TIR) receptor domain-containing protein [Tieghemostelium lacteum]